MILEKLKQSDKLFSNQIQYQKEDVLYIEDKLWTSKQKQSSSLHEIPYRACFKAEIPNFFITKLSQPMDVVYDPFVGRGTTGIKATLLKRKIILNDVNPLGQILSQPRIFILTIQAVNKRLNYIFDLKDNAVIKKLNFNLDMFFHPQTERGLLYLKSFFKKTNNPVDRWIKMIATTRLTGHSKGYFSVYTLPPNQAISIKKQIELNKKRKQKPEYRNVKQIILEKIIKPMLNQLSNIPFKLVIKSITEFTVLSFKKLIKKEKKILDQMIQISKNIANKKGIRSKRINEVGNKIESIVNSILNKIGLEAQIPTALKGGKKLAGYPSIFFSDKKNNFYLECKTYNKNNVKSSLRTFYLSPSKIIQNAYHILLAFEIETAKKGIFFTLKTIKFFH